MPITVSCNLEKEATKVRRQSAEDKVGRQSARSVVAGGGAEDCREWSKRAKAKVQRRITKGDASAFWPLPLSCDPGILTRSYGCGTVAAMALDVGLWPWTPAPATPAATPLQIVLSLGFLPILTAT